MTGAFYGNIGAEATQNAGDWKACKVGATCEGAVPLGFAAYTVACDAGTSVQIRTVPSATGAMRARLVVNYLMPLSK